MKILVVDDEVEVVNFLKVFLGRMGIEAVEATCGLDAIEAYARVNPDWVFLDIKMPDMNGLQVLRKLKESNNTVKAIMITGSSDEVLENEAKELGVRDYLVKPIDLTELRLKIRTYILEESKQGASSV